MANELDMNPCRLNDMIKGRLKGYKYRRRISQYLGIEEEVLFPDNGNQVSCQPQGEQNGFNQ